ncbi:N-acetyl-gamma-glutamyl-phosphate reductase [Camelliibacillus cellulosilyticus]|uniref:N-acetyl-gamma-glutamyl-phosphate reductase n=1 Tax=Camelliibacillus cellulosilyticus TaxID=2174486 RepID=A0ABV9GLH5_9BACL
MKIGIIGANGYSGIELIRLLKSHPFIGIETLVSHTTSGTAIEALYPHLAGICEMTLDDLDADRVADRVDLLFFATPAGISKGILPAFIEKGVKCIDLSGDFRLKRPAQYEKWYRKPAGDPSYIDQAVYGLTELNREIIKKARLIANPGCYPTAAILGLLPALKATIIRPTSLVIDGKSGVSGAGRGVSLATHYCEVNENVHAYKLGSHQHTPEIEQTIQEITGNPVSITFSTHLVPMTRGMMCTIYADLTESTPLDEAIDYYQSFYQSDPFVRVRAAGEWPSTKDVGGSNYCDIGLAVDERSKKLIIVSVIDNLIKGASGQAIQNMNVLFGWEETAGLGVSPIYP